jgi:hypothetical protein
MTNREFYTAVANGTINEEIVAHATSAIEKMDAALANRKNKPNKKALENAPIIESILGVLTTEPMTAAAVAEAVGISTQKASALLRQIVANGDAVASEVKVPNKGTCKAYALASTEA